ILDPSRSVEGNFVQYSVATVDGRVLNGLLAPETKTSIELLAAEGKTDIVLRDETEELAASTKPVMPEGFETPTTPQAIADSPQGTFPPGMPESVSLPCHTSAKAIHLLSGVSGWGYLGQEVLPTVSMIVRLHYADGSTEDHPLRNGVHFADYIRPVDVPGSKL